MVVETLLAYNAKLDCVDLVSMIIWLTSTLVDTQLLMTHVDKIKPFQDIIHT